MDYSMGVGESPTLNQRNVKMPIFVWGSISFIFGYMVFKCICEDIEKYQDDTDKTDNTIGGLVLNNINDPDHDDNKQKTKIKGVTIIE